MSSVISRLERGDFDDRVLWQALECRGVDQEALFALARTKRSACFPAEQVEVRSVIEVSNVCRQCCNYCNMGLLASQERYTIAYDEFMRLATYLYGKGRRVLLLQSGENGEQAFVDLMSRCVQGLTHAYADLVVVLCLGSLEEAQYRQLREAGAARYVLKFETANAGLYETLKPRDTLARRLGCLESLLRLGYAVGSGDMVGLPDQTPADLTDDLRLLGRYALAMSSCTVFVPGESSRYRDKPMGDVDTTLNMMALMRILYPDRLIPTTSSLEKGRAGGQYLGLMAGGNTVTVHDGTPDELKHLFPIYSTHRFTPQDEHFKRIVESAHLTLAPGPLR